jgi:hypothetical protein
MVSSNDLVISQGIHVDHRQAMFTYVIAYQGTITADAVWHIGLVGLAVYDYGQIVSVALIDQES